MHQFQLLSVGCKNVTNELSHTHHVREVLIVSSLRLVAPVRNGDAHAEADALLVEELRLGLINLDVGQFGLLENLLLQKLIPLQLNSPFFAVKVLKGL